MTRGNNVPALLNAFSVDSESDKGNLPRYVTWDANMDASFGALTKTFEELMAVTSMPPDVFGLHNYGTASESGVAMRFRYAGALGRVNRKRAFILPPLMRIFRAALFLATGATLNMKDISIVTSDGLPDDPNERAQIASVWRSAGLGDQRAAMQYARPDLTDDAAKEEIALIDAENSMEPAYDNDMPKYSEALSNGGNSA